MSRVEGNRVVHEAVWQAKFTSRLDASTKRAISKSIAALRDRGDIDVGRWILCLPVDPTGVFLDWLTREVPSQWRWEVWGATRLLEILEANPDVTEAFFYAPYEELRQFFAFDKLELVRFLLDPACQWSQPDAKVLHFSNQNVRSPDLVVDVIVRNFGRLDAVLLGLEAELFDCERVLHGIPGEGLLWPQITYAVSINDGQPGVYASTCEPPLKIRAGSVERFKIRMIDTGYAWRGTVIVMLNYGDDRRLRLPALRLYA